jgi:hypothetical protein
MMRGPHRLMVPMVTLSSGDKTLDCTTVSASSSKPFTA